MAARDGRKKGEGFGAGSQYQPGTGSFAAAVGETAGGALGGVTSAAGGAGGDVRGKNAALDDDEDVQLVSEMRKQLGEIARKHESGELNAFGSRQYEVLKGYQHIRQQQLSLALEQMNLALAAPYFTSDADGNPEGERGAELEAFFDEKEKEVSKLTAKLQDFCSELGRDGDSSVLPKDDFDT